MTVTPFVILRRFAAMGLWCNGTTALRQRGRCGFDSRQVHTFSGLPRRCSNVGAPVDGDGLSS